MLNADSNSHWSPYRDTDRADGGIAIDDIVSAPEAEHQVFATGQYRAKTLSGALQHLSCDLRTTAPLHTSGLFSPGLCLSYTYSGGWHSQLGERRISMDSHHEMAVCGASTTVEYVEAQPENTRIKMSCLYIGMDFFTDSEAPPEVILSLMKPAEVTFARLPTSPALQTLLQQMYALNGDGYLARLQMNSLAYGAVYELTRALGERPQPALSSPRQRDLAEATKDLLDSQLACRPMVADIAAMLATNESSLRRAFRATFGVSITDYVRHRLMDEARALVREGRLHIAEIAYRSGFSDPANFTTAYRRHFGTPPSGDRH
ncbi:MAG: AraC family transcriptional regulator [Asticcacaulis sp.]